MRVFAKLALAAVALAALTTTASAAVNLTSPTGGVSGLNAPSNAVWDFEGGAGDDTAHFSFFGGGVFSGSATNQYQTPSGDGSNFGAAGFDGGGHSPYPGTPNATFSTNSGLEFTSFSAYIGSLDQYNVISFLHNGTLIDSFSGGALATIAGNGAAANSTTSDAANRRFFFTFDASDQVNQIVFSSQFPAFEFDNFAATITGVPEPQTWAMMILGFGFIGLMLRNGRRRSAVVA